jgi:DNA-binding IclR family transcriptional regulator
VSTPKLTSEQLGILRHALRPDRGRMVGIFVSDEDDPACTEMVSAGLMSKRPAPFPMGGSVPFYVTDVGRAALAAHEANK